MITNAAFAELFKDFVVGYSFAYHSFLRINEREFGKIREKGLTVKDFQPNRSTGRHLPDCYDRGYLGISVEVNCNSQDYNVLDSEVV